MPDAVSMLIRPLAPVDTEPVPHCRGLCFRPERAWRKDKAEPIEDFLAGPNPTSTNWARVLPDTVIRPARASRCAGHRVPPSSGGSIGSARRRRDRRSQRTAIATTIRIAMIQMVQPAAVMTSPHRRRNDRPGIARSAPASRTTPPRCAGPTTRACRSEGHLWVVPEHRPVKRTRTSVGCGPPGEVDAPDSRHRAGEFDRLHPSDVGAGSADGRGHKPLDRAGGSFCCLANRRFVLIERRQALKA